MRLNKWGIVMLAALLLAVVIPVAAQEGTPELPGESILTDIFAPRGVEVDEEGNLYVAIAGNGGDRTIQAQTPDGVAEVGVGMTGSVTVVAPDGSSSELLSALPSYLTPSEALGVYRAIPHGGSLWVIYSMLPGTLYGNTIVELELATMTVRTVINMSAYEADNNPDGNEIDSNVADIDWAADGTLLIADAGANTLYSWTQEAGLAVVNTWPENSVPDSIDVAEDGSVYIGFLGAGLAPGAGRIEQWQDGELVNTWDGLNAVSDILVTDEGVLAVELIRFGAEGPGPGGVVLVAPDGTVTPVVEGLMAPFGIAQAADGALYVSYGTIAFAPGMTGGVIRIAGGM